MRLIADKAFRFAGKPLAVGDEFSANNRDGRVLVAVNRAHLAEGEESVESAPVPKKAVKKPAKKRTYKRRDLQAEE